ncbi:MAG TPA: prepilin-type N-terminal cleavage/methylation domain-containing protein [Solirubrobacteraceae bacterium]|nr:prepilin-type N-terminal cleavage/methylation domain-containing protein [Solirubrobacteraceae bacterium]
MRFIERLRGERGMTLIELLVAATICAVGTIATIGVIDTSRSVSVKSEKRDAMAHQAERELERLMELPWANLGHVVVRPTANPTPAGNPSTYIAGDSYKYDRNNPSATEQLVALVDGQVPNTSAEWDDAQTRLTGRVYRYVTRVGANARRITVVVTANGEHSPPELLLSSIKTTPVL